jgi:predicted anti-sigma-YlaC factor YlaD
LLLPLAAAGGCSLRELAVGGLGDALSGGGAAYASDDDPELVRAATPFSLKVMESVLAERPDHSALLLATARAFTQYTYAFVQQDADEIEDRDIAAAYRLRERARGLYRRARDYGLRGLEVNHPGFGQALSKSPAVALGVMTSKDVPDIYWTGVSWAAMVALEKDDPQAVPDVPIIGAIAERALALDESYDHGAVHVFMIAFEMARGSGRADSEARAREHYRRALELSGGLQAGPHVSLAEAVSVPTRNRSEFAALLRSALAVDPDAAPRWRLANLVMQRRARWLLARADQFFTE